VKLSVIVPAYNEEKLIAGSLRSIRESLAANARPGLETEVIVADNNSTDATARLAREAGATVVFEPVNQIGRARNAGAAAATGDWLVFIDADSHPSPGLIGAVLDAIERGGVAGGGSTVSMRGFSWKGRLILRVWNAVSRTLRWAAGSFIFCRADAFRAAGGFNLDLYATEELDFSKRLKRLARDEGTRFVILRSHPLETSPRRLQLYTMREMLALAWTAVLHPLSAPRRKEHVRMWYDGRR
jgi:glycosyltransferase involved in cell wall biosynthesis